MEQISTIISTKNVKQASLHIYDNGGSIEIVYVGESMPTMLGYNTKDEEQRKYYERKYRQAYQLIQQAILEGKEYVTLVL